MQSSDTVSRKNKAIGSSYLLKMFPWECSFKVKEYKNKIRLQKVSDRMVP